MISGDPGPMRDKDEEKTDSLDAERRHRELLAAVLGVAALLTPEQVEPRQVIHYWKELLKALPEKARLPDNESTLKHPLPAKVRAAGSGPAAETTTHQPAD